MDVFVLTAALSILVIVVLRWWWTRAGDCEELDCFDAFTDAPVEDEGGKACSGAWAERGVVTRLAYEAALAAKEKYGELRYTNANRLVVGDYVREYLRVTHPDLRVVDRVKHATYAVELALTPTSFSLAAARFARNQAVVERRAAVSLPK